LLFRSPKNPKTQKKRIILYFIRMNSKAKI